MCLTSAASEDAGVGKAELDGYWLAVEESSFATNSRAAGLEHRIGAVRDADSWRSRIVRFGSIARIPERRDVRLLFAESSRPNVAIL